MKRVKNRANAVIIIALLLIAGLCLYLIRLVDNGREWAMFKGNQGIYQSGALSVGTLRDRNGTLLASSRDGVFRYADSELHRRACLHVIGDYRGMIGTGVLNALPERQVGYSFVNGTYSVDGRGKDVYLTIDANLNAVAYSALAGRRGAVLLMNYKTGEILCMVSSIGYDPNNPPNLTEADDQYEGVYLNRCISSTFVPGSIFKIVTMAAALESIGDINTRTFYCAGFTEIDGKRVNCTGAHGVQTVGQAFANSCNVAFAEISLELGANTLSEYASNLGLTSAHGMSGIETAAGNFSRAAPQSAELAWSGIGQHEDLVSPYAMLRLCAAIANGGAVVEPVLFDSGAFPPTNTILENRTANRLAEMMCSNVTNAYGTWNFPNLSIGAKTGTAELGEGYPHSWSAGFVSDGSHPYAFVVLVENGGTGLGAASSLANTLLQAACG